MIKRPCELFLLNGTVLFSASAPLVPAVRKWALAAPVPFVLALTFLLLSDTTDYPERMTTAAALSAGLGAILLIVRLTRRR